MRVDGTSPLNPLGPAQAAPAAAPRPPRSADAPSFAQLLQERMARPRSHIAVVRAGIRSEIDAIRTGGHAERTADGIVASDGTSAALERLLPYELADAGGPDPFGWRSLTRRLGDSLVGPGYGAIFERQIEQESGYSPEVAFGLRRSSAGAEGIAQLMPEYYPTVDRTDPGASLVAAAQTMRHYLDVFDGDVRKALASYNAGLGRVRALVDAHGDGWERALPAETQAYLAAIVGTQAPQRPVVSTLETAVFGGLGPGGVLTLPIDDVIDERSVDGLLDLLGAAGAAVGAPADGRVARVQASGDVVTVLIDHGNGWTTSLEGLTGLLVAVGQSVRRGEQLGVLAESIAGQGRLRLGVSLDGRALDPARYVLRA